MSSTMGIEEVEIDGQLITVQPPVTNISIHGSDVKYQDGTGVTVTSFSTEAIAEQFAQWLADQPL